MTKCNKHKGVYIVNEYKFLKKQHKNTPWKGVKYPKQLHDKLIKEHLGLGLSDIGLANLVCGLLLKNYGYVYYLENEIY